MNSIFSINRLWLLIKRDFAELRKSIFYFSIVIFLTLLFIYVYAYVHSLKHILEQKISEHYISSINTDLITITIMIFIVFLAYVCGKAFYSKSKGERIVFSTLPSTNAEKFASRLILRVAGGAVLFILIALAADASKGLFIPLFVKANYTLSLFVTEIQLDTEAESWSEIFFFMSMLSAIYSFFLFNSAFWHKNPVGHAGMISGLIIFITANITESINIATNHDGTPTIVYFIVSALFALAACLLVLSYRFFTTDSLKERKVF